MKRKRKRYTEEFKKEAARMVIMEGMGVPEVAEKLGVSSVLIYRWKDAYLNEMGGSGDDGEMNAQDLAAELDRVRKKLAKAERINEILKKNGGLLCEGRSMKYQFIKDNQERHGVDDLCEALGVERSGYYDWKNRGESKRSLEDAVIKEGIQKVHKRARGRYGHRPIYHHLQDDAIECGRDRTLRLMNEMGLEGSQAKRFKPLGTDSNHLFGYSANLLKELGQPAAINQVWVADTTYLQKLKSWILAVALRFRVVYNFPIYLYILIII